MARSEGQPTPSNPPSSPDRSPRLSRRSLLKGVAGVAGVAVANELTGRPLLPSGAEAHEVIPHNPQPGSEPVVPVKPASPLDEFIQKGVEAAQSGIGAIRKELAVLAGKPAAAHGLDEKNTKSNRVAVTERRVMEVRSSSFINNVETFGHEQALTDTEMRQLIENLNARVGALSPEERVAMMRNDTYYGTMFISETAYRAFFTDNSETFQTFLKRHEVECRRMFKNARPSIIPSSINEESDEVGIKVIRLIVVKDGVAPPASNHLGYLAEGPRDSDGGGGIPQNPYLTYRNNIYKPQLSPRWDSVKKLDRTFNHEMIGHGMSHLYDQYAFNFRTYDYEKEKPLSTFIKNIPTRWQMYSADWRKDITSQNDLMIGGREDEFGLYSSWQVYRRNAYNHDLARIIPEIGAAPYEFPQQVKMQLNDIQGNKIELASVQIYKTKGNGSPWYGKDFMETPVHTGDLKNLTPQTLFEKDSQGFVSLTDATLFVKIRATNGREYFRWMDVRDFNLAYWTTGNAGVVAMDMKVIATDDTTTTPESFDWTIRSSTKRSLVPIIPRLFGGLSN